MTRRNGHALLTAGAGLYLVLHYVVVCWLTFHLLNGVSALHPELVMVGGIAVRLWWLVAALIVAVAFSVHVSAITTWRDEEFLYIVLRRS